MSFTSPYYYLLLAFSFAVYWVLPTLKVRRRFLVVVSFLFYSLWNFRFFGLLVVSATSDYVASLLLAREKRPAVRKALLILTLVINFGILFFFKFFGFFMPLMNVALHGFGAQGFDPNVILLPLGISFYTFHTVSYTMDVYRGKAEPIRNFWDYFLFVCYFPQLVAGPIARVNSLYPQFFVEKKLELERTADGLLLIGFGFLVKCLLADNLGAVADLLFDKPNLNASLGWTAVFAFGYQIYADFWSYTLIARGSSRLFGIELNQNFRQPYLSDSPTEFWRRWHMSLSNWFRDYLYIPLGGNQRHAAFNLVFTMAIAGIWHGNSWLFLLWGLYHGLLLVAFKAVRLPRFVTIPLTYFLVQLGWVLFRSQTLEQAKRVYVSLVDFSAFDTAYATPVLLVAGSCTLLMLIDIAFDRYEKHELDFSTRLSYGKFALASAMVMCAMYLGETGATPFIYFNF